MTFIFLLADIKGVATRLYWQVETQNICISHLTKYQKGLMGSSYAKITEIGLLLVLIRWVICLSRKFILSQKFKITFFLFLQLFFEDLAEKEKIARQMNEPSPFVDYLDDDLKLIHSISDNTSNPVKMIGKSKKMDGKKESNGSFHPDQFPCLPQPSIKDESIFCF